MFSAKVLLAKVLLYYQARSLDRALIARKGARGADSFLLLILLSIASGALVVEWRSR